jgi:hypothetical protein
VRGGRSAHGGLLAEVAPARLFDEAIKLFHGGYGLQTFEMLRRYDLFRYLFPATEESLTHEENGFPITFVANALKNTDERIHEGKGVNPAFLYAVMLWEPVRRMADRLIESDMPWLRPCSRPVPSCWRNRRRISPSPSASACPCARSGRCSRASSSAGAAAHCACWGIRAFVPPMISTACGPPPARPWRKAASGGPGSRRSAPTSSGA